VSSLEKLLILVRTKACIFFAANYPELKGFNYRGLYRMKQFYELYKDNEKVSPLVTQYQIGRKWL